MTPLESAGGERYGYGFHAIERSESIAYRWSRRWFGFYFPGREVAGLAEHPASRPDRACHLAWSECFVGVDGGVAPCDMYLAETTKGNLLDAEFRAIWNGPDMVTMRRHVNVDPRGLCGHGTCMFRPSRTPRADETYPIDAHPGAAYLPGDAG